MSHPDFPHISQFFIHSPMYCVSKINGIVSLIHQSLYCSVIFWVSLAPEVRHFFWVIHFFLYLSWRKCAKYGGKNLHEKGGKTQAFKISVSKFTLLEKKETTLLEADVDTVSVIEDGKSSLEPLPLQRGIDGPKNSCDWSPLQLTEGQQKLWRTKSETSLPRLMCRTLISQFFLFSSAGSNIHLSDKVRLVWEGNYRFFYNI